MQKLNQDRPIRGVNLGGWLVLEKWITPSVFVDTPAIDEWTYCQQADAALQKRLTDFRNDFITEADFTWLKDHGIQSVRLPVGYWAFGDEPPYMPTVDYIDKAFKWAEKYGLSIVLDVHGAQGSQNGKEHSGQTGAMQWNQPSTITNTINFVWRLAKRYGKSPVLLGIELLNEPGSHVDKNALFGYYKQCYEIIRSTCGDDTWIIFSDFYTSKRWRKQLPAKTYKNVFIDTHYYQIFSPLDKALPCSVNLWRARHELPWKLRRLQATQPVIVGEWSLGLAGTGKQPNEQSKLALTRQYAEAQLQAFQQTRAWYFWTYKTEAQDIWNFRVCVEQGWLKLK